MPPSTGFRSNCHPNLFLTMMDRMGVQAEHFGDSTGALDGLSLS